MGRKTRSRNVAERRAAVAGGRGQRHGHHENALWWATGTSGTSPTRPTPTLQPPMQPAITKGCSGRRRRRRQGAIAQRWNEPRPYPLSTRGAGVTCTRPPPPRSGRRARLGGAQRSAPPHAAEKSYAALQSRSTTHPVPCVGAPATTAPGRTTPAAAVASIRSRPVTKTGGGHRRQPHAPRRGRGKVPSRHGSTTTAAAGC